MPFDDDGTECRVPVSPWSALLRRHYRNGASALAQQTLRAIEFRPSLLGQIASASVGKERHHADRAAQTARGDIRPSHCFRDGFGALGKQPFGRKRGNGGDGRRPESSRRPIGAHRTRTTFCSAFRGFLGISGQRRLLCHRLMQANARARAEVLSRSRGTEISAVLAGSTATGQRGRRWFRSV